MLFFSWHGYGQQLIMYHTFGGARFEYNKDTSTFSVSPKQVSQILHDDPVAYEEFKKARLNYGAAGVLGFIGGILIVIPIGTAIARGDPEWVLAAGGAAIIIGSIPLTSAFKHHAENAIDMYNRKHTAFRPRAEYFVAGLGARVVIKF